MWFSSQHRVNDVPRVQALTDREKKVAAHRYSSCASLVRRMPCGKLGFQYLLLRHLTIEWMYPTLLYYLTESWGVFYNGRVLIYYYGKKLADWSNYFIFVVDSFNLEAVALHTKMMVIEIRSSFAWRRESVKFSTKHNMNIGTIWNFWSSYSMNAYFHHQIVESTPQQVFQSSSNHFREADERCKLSFTDIVALSIYWSFWNSWCNEYTNVILTYQTIKPTPQHVSQSPGNILRAADKRYRFSFSDVVEFQSLSEKDKRHRMTSTQLPTMTICWTIWYLVYNEITNVYPHRQESTIQTGV